MGMMTPEKYAEIFPQTSYAETVKAGSPTFGEYAQTWLDAKAITLGTRKNYLWALNLYWMPHFATTPIDKITTVMIRKVANQTEWVSPAAKRNALLRLSTVFKAAVYDDLITRNPVSSIELPERAKPKVDPFTFDEANAIIDWLYENLKWQSQIYACYFEFSFFTGMRPAEISALRWEEVDMDLRTAHVCRVVANGKIEERTKTKHSRIVLLNERAIGALRRAQQIALDRSRRALAFPESRYVFPPAKIAEYITQSSTTDRYFKAALRSLGIRDRPQYNCRHTYASLCLTVGMKPAFIAGQLGHSVQMLLSTYAKWLNDSASDWSELNKLSNDRLGNEPPKLKHSPKRNLIREKTES